MPGCLDFPFATTLGTFPLAIILSTINTENLTFEIANHNIVLINLAWVINVCNGKSTFGTFFELASVGNIITAKWAAVAFRQLIFQYPETLMTFWTR